MNLKYFLFALFVAFLDAKVCTEFSCKICQRVLAKKDNTVQMEKPGFQAFSAEMICEIVMTTRGCCEKYFLSSNSLM